MPIGATVGVAVFCVMALFAVLAAIIAAVASVTGIDHPKEDD